MGASNSVGSGALTVSGGTVDMGASQNNTVGTVTVSGGGSIVGTGTSAITSTGTFEMQNGTVSAILAGSGIALNKTTTSTVTLSGANTYTGATTIAASGGTLNVQNNTALGTGTAGTTVNSGGTLALQNNITISNGTLSLTGTGASSVGALTNVSGSNTWTGNITLAGNTTISSQAGTLNLGTVPTYFTPSGHTQPDAPTYDNKFLTIGGQTLTLSGAGNIVINERIQDVASQYAGTRYSSTGPGNFTLQQSPAYNPAPASVGNVTVNMTGSGSVMFQANANAYTGTTTVQAGTLILATLDNTARGHDAVTDSFHAINGPLVIGTGSGPGATVQLADVYPTSEAIAKSSTVTLYNDGTLNLHGQSQTIDALTFNGGTVSGNGTLYLNNNVTVNSSGGAQASITGGTLSLTLSPNATVDATVLAHPEYTVRDFNVVNTGAANGLQIDSVVTKGSLSKSGVGTLTLTNENQYNGTTSVTNGILNIQKGTGLTGSALGLGDGSVGQGTSVSGTGTLQLQGNIAVTTEMLTLSGNGYSPGGVPLGALNNLSGSNTFGTAATTLINLAADARINSSAGTLNLVSNISSTASNALTVGGAGDTVISGSIATGAGASTTLTKDGGGTLTLSGSNTYQGATNITAGIVSVQNKNGLGAISTGSNGTFVSSGAELQLSNVAHGDLTGANKIGGEALSLNGAGIGGTSGALNNFIGNNEFGGVVTLATPSTIKSTAGTLTLSGGVTSSHQALTVTGSGDTTINPSSAGALTTGTVTRSGSNIITAVGSGGTLDKQGSGTLTIAGGTTSQVDGTTLTAGNITVSGSGTTLLSGALGTGGATPAGTTTLTINSSATVQAFYATGTTTTFNGSLASTVGAGTFEKDGPGTLVFNHTFTATNLTLVLNGGTLSLASSAQITVGTIHITGDLVLDFNGNAGTFLSSTNLQIDSGVTVTVNNWMSVANDAAASTAWYATTNINSSPLGGSDQVGGGALSQIIFTGYSPGLTTTWVSGNHGGWFDHEIRPTPEPSTYGALLLSGCLGLLGWKRFRRKKNQG